MKDLYRDRYLSMGHGELDTTTFIQMEHSRSDDHTPRVERHLRYLDRLFDVTPPKHVLVLGCGPRPQFVKILKQKNYKVVGIEPITSFVQSAAKYLGSADLVMQGAAENIPVEDKSQQIVFFHSVFEHVDSPTKTLNEIYRVLIPGGVLVMSTTNRYRFSLTGKNGEYHIAFFNWLPSIVKECYIHHHLHFDPQLANYTMRPAVHWPSYSDLCALGREAGFAKFYHPIDLATKEDLPLQTGNPLLMFLQRALVDKIKFNPWLRALALMQLGNSIYMYKRAENE